MTNGRSEHSLTKPLSHYLTKTLPHYLTKPRRSCHRYQGKEYKLRRVGAAVLEIK